MLIFTRNSVAFCLILMVYSTQASKTRLTTNASKRLSLTIGGIHIKGSFEVTVNGAVPVPQLGTRNNPAPSCRAILEKNSAAQSGVYYIKTHPTVTKVYCYMEDIPGCGGGGWTTIMKTDGYKKTFLYKSAYWTNKIPYHVINGQSGADDKETKLPTYWTLPFNRLCLGMKPAGQHNPRWISFKYKASSLYSVIADGQYRKVSIGRNKWKSLIAGSSLQKNCNREGFNVVPGDANHERVRIGILGNNENSCNSCDSRVGFGGDGIKCGRGKLSTGNCARHFGDNGDKTIRTHGYILAQ